MSQIRSPPSKVEVLIHSCGALVALVPLVAFAADLLRVGLTHFDARGSKQGAALLALGFGEAGANIIGAALLILPTNSFFAAPAIIF